MSKIINGLKENGEALATSINLAVVAVSGLFIAFHGVKTTLDWQVLIAYILVVGFAIYKWDRVHFRESNKFQMGMVVFLVALWLNIGEQYNIYQHYIFTPLMVLFFIINLYYWSYFWLQDIRIYKPKSETVK